MKREERNSQQGSFAEAEELRVPLGKTKGRRAEAGDPVDPPACADGCRGREKWSRWAGYCTVIVVVGVQAGPGPPVLFALRLFPPDASVPPPQPKPVRLS